MKLKVHDYMLGVMVLCAFVLVIPSFIAIVAPGYYYHDGGYISLIGSLVSASSSTSTTTWGELIVIMGIVQTIETLVTAGVPALIFLVHRKEKKAGWLIALAIVLGIASLNLGSSKIFLFLSIIYIVLCIAEPITFRIEKKKDNQ